jgi:hypothetical protein
VAINNPAKAMRNSNARHMSVHPLGCLSLARHARHVCLGGPWPYASKPGSAQLLAICSPRSSGIGRKLPLEFERHNPVAPAPTAGHRPPRSLWRNASGWRSAEEGGKNPAPIQPILSAQNLRLCRTSPASCHHEFARARS